MALTQVQSGMMDSIAQYNSFKNRIINGAMVIDQRNAGASVTQTTAGGVFSVDRWAIYGSVTSKFTAQQNAGSVTTTAGFPNYLGCTSSSAYTVGASEYYVIRQPIEGFNFADLNFGTANAATVTLSFWVRSSLTGTFGGSFFNYGGTRFYPFSYSIPVANTWTSISITIPGDTSGTWVGSSNAGAAWLTFSLGAGATVSGTAGSWGGTAYQSATGAVSVVGTSGATFYITGVQLEKGSTATSFDVRDYGRELQMCQRYYQTGYAFQQGSFGYYMAYYGGSNAVSPQYQTIVPMRAAPTVTFSNASVQYYSYANVWTNTTLTGGSYSNTNIFIYALTDGDGRGKLFRTGSSGTAPSPYYIFSSEL